METRKVTIGNALDELEQEIPTIENITEVKNALLSLTRIISGILAER